MLLTKKEIARFESFYWQGPDCWNWLGALSTRPNGKVSYGNFRLKGTILRSHRVAYLIEYGPFDESLDVLHKCDNPPCVNPAHLFLGTKTDNMIDMHKKNRHPRSTPLEDVVSMIELYKSGKYNQYQLAERFNVSNQAVSRFINGLRRNY